MLPSGFSFSDSCHFRDMSWCRGLFGFILFATLRVSWTWVSVSFPRGGKFSAIISLNKVCSFFPSPSGIPIMRTFEHLMLSRSSLKLSAFVKFLLLFAVLTGFFPPVCAVADAFLSVPGVWSCAGAWALARQAGWLSGRRSCSHSRPLQRQEAPGGAAGDVLW